MRLKPLAAVTAAVMTAAAFAAPATAQPATTIPVVLTEFHYAPSEIDLVHGQTYVFRVTNDGKHGHNLSAKAFFASVTLDPASAPAVKDGAVEVVSGETAEVTLTPNTAGTYEMHCTHPLHSMLGMSGKIVVR